MEINLASKGLTPAGHVSFSDLTGQAGTDGDGLKLELMVMGSNCQVLLKLNWTAHVSFSCWNFHVS